MVKKITSLLLIFALLFVFATGCDNAPAPEQGSSAPVVEQETTPVAEAPATKTIINVDGTEIVVPVDVQNVGAIFGPSYEKIVMLGAESKIVCDGDFHIDGWPWSNVIYKHLNDVPGIVNAHDNLNVEDLAKYNLDVVFNFPNPNTTKSLEEGGISVVPMAGTGKFSDLKATIRVYAEALGGDAIAVADRYDEYFDSIVDRVTSVTAGIPEADRPLVYFSNQEFLFTAGNNSDLVEVMELAGGNCVTKDLAGGSKTEVTKEQLLTWNPDFVFVDHAGSSGNEPAEVVIENMLTDPDFSQVSAVKNSDVYIVPTGVFFWDSGVQKPLMLLWMAQILHPDQFADVDMKAELTSFYSEFFDYDLTEKEAELILAHLNPEQ